MCLHAVAHQRRAHSPCSHRMCMFNSTRAQQWCARPHWSSGQCIAHDMSPAHACLPQTPLLICETAEPWVATAQRARELLFSHYRQGRRYIWAAHRTQRSLGLHDMPNEGVLWEGCPIFMACSFLIVCFHAGTMVCLDIQVGWYSQLE